MEITMAMAPTHGQTNPSTLAAGRTAKSAAGELSPVLMVPPIKVTIKTTKKMV